MNSLEAAFDRLPGPILDKLEAMIRRVRRLLLIRGLFATLAVALGCLLVIMAVDAAVTLFSPTARWTLSLAGLAVTLVAAWWFLVRPLSRRLTLTHMARILEIRHPELQERISTAVELLSSDDPDSIKGSEELIGAVVDSAVVDVGGVDPRTEFQAGRAARFMTATAACAAVLLLALAIWPRQSWTLFARAVAPFLDIGNAWADTLVVDPGDVRIARGDPVSVEVSVDHERMRRVELRRRLPDGSESVERMTPAGGEDGTRRFSVNFPAVEESFAYRIRAGSALTRHFQVTAVSPPAVDELVIGYDYPDYTGLDSAEGPSETGEIRAVAHTRVTVAATANKPVDSAKLTVGENTGIEPSKVEGRRLTWRFELLPQMRGSWRVELNDEEGFESEPRSHPIQVLPDKAPTVQLTRPAERELRLRPTEQLPLGAAIVEDFGIADSSLLVTPDGASEPRVISLPEPVAVDGPDDYRGRTTLDLASLDLSPDQRRLGVRWRVRDRRPARYDGPGVGFSETVFITLDRQAKSLAEQKIEKQREAVEENLREAKKNLQRARDEMKRTEREVQRSDEVEPRTRQRLEEFTDRTGEARERLDEVAAALDGSLMQSESDRARRLADETLAEARKQADLIPVTDGKDPRRAEAARSRQAVEEAIEGVDRIAEAMREADDDFRAISQLNDLASRQQELAGNTDQWAEDAERRSEEMRRQANEEARRQFEQEQRQELDRFRNEQEQVQQKLGEMLKDNASALEDILRNQQAEADRMGREAGELAEQQQSLREANREASKSESDQQETLTEELLDRLWKAQSALSNEARQHAEQGRQGEDAPSTAKDESSRSLAEAADRADEAAEDLRREALADAARAAREAEERLARAASEPGAETEDESSAPEPSPPGDSSAGDPEAVSRLAERQRSLAEQIEAVRDGQPQKALGLMEEQIDAEARSLQARSGAFQEAMRNLEQQAAQSRAQQAGQSLKQGARQASDSSRRLARAQQQQNRAVEQEKVEPGQLDDGARSSMQQGGGDQQRSAQSLSRASQALSRSSEALEQARDGLEPGESDDRIADSEEMAEGFDQVSRSARSQDARQAARNSRQAAEAMQRLARQASQRLGQPGDPSPPEGESGPSEQNTQLTSDPSSTDPTDSGRKTADADGSGVPPELQELGISQDDWARFEGAVSSGSASAIESELPAEYRELVGRYFQVIAREAEQESPD